MSSVMPRLGQCESSLSFGPPLGQAGPVSAAASSSHADDYRQLERAVSFGTPLGQAGHVSAEASSGDVDDYVFSIEDLQAMASLRWGEDHEARGSAGGRTMQPQAMRALASLQLPPGEAPPRGRAAASGEDGTASPVPVLRVYPNTPRSVTSLQPDTARGRGRSPRGRGPALPPEYDVRTMLGEEALAYTSSSGPSSEASVEAAKNIPGVYGAQSSASLASLELPCLSSRAQSPSAPPPRLTSPDLRAHSRRLPGRQVASALSRISSGTASHTVTRLETPSDEADAVQEAIDEEAAWFRPPTRATRATGNPSPPLTPRALVPAEIKMLSNYGPSHYPVEVRTLADSADAQPAFANADDCLAPITNNAFVDKPDSFESGYYGPSPQPVLAGYSGPSPLPSFEAVPDSFLHGYQIPSPQPLVEDRPDSFEGGNYGPSPQPVLEGYSGPSPKPVFEDAPDPFFQGYKSPFQQPFFEDRPDSFEGDNYGPSLQPCFEDGPDSFLQGYNRASPQPFFEERPDSFEGDYYGASPQPFFEDRPDSCEGDYYGASPQPFFEDRPDSFEGDYYGTSPQPFFENGPDSFHHGYTSPSPQVAVIHDGMERKLLGRHQLPPEIMSVKTIRQAEQKQYRDLSEFVYHHPMPECGGCDFILDNLAINTDDDIALGYGRDGIYKGETIAGVFSAMAHLAAGVVY